MKIQETLRKPMLEAKYLNVDDTDRYRPIIRLFYLNYEKLKYWMYQEEVYEEFPLSAFGGCGGNRADGHPGGESLYRKFFSGTYTAGKDQRQPGKAFGDGGPGAGEDLCLVE